MKFDWEELLVRWNKELLEDEQIRAHLPLEVLDSAWLGYPGATDTQIAHAEARLGTTLPPSYRDFLKFTNGWRQIGPFIYKLWSTEEIDWFSVRNQDWIDAYLQGGLPPVPDEEYFTYGDDQDPTSFRVEYLQTTLEISDVGDSAIFLLNPRVVTSDGE